MIFPSSGAYETNRVQAWRWLHRPRLGLRDGLFKIAGDIVRKDGVLGLWGSVSIIAACQSMLEKFGYFFAYTLLRSLYRRFTGR